MVYDLTATSKSNSKIRVEINVKDELEYPILSLKVST